MKPLRDCLYCRSAFEVTRKDKRYCSDMCCSTAAAIRSAKRNPDKVRENKRRWDAQNPEKVAASRAASRERNREKRRAAGREYYARKREWILQKQAIAYLVDPGRFRRASRKWEQANPDAARAKKLRRRGRGPIRAEDLRILKRVLGERCLVCDGAPISWDHITPLAHGGTNSPLNLQPLCLSCNSKKGARSATDHREPGRVSQLAAYFDAQC